MTRKKAKKKSSKGKIVYDKKEFVELATADFKGKSTDIPHSRSDPKGGGIYALYDNHGLYYVGLTDFSLRHRIQTHTQDRHKGKWKRFSWYHVPNVRAIKDLESVLISVLDPKGNTNKGKLRKK